MKNETLTTLTTRMCDRIDDIAIASENLNQLLNDPIVVRHTDYELIDDDLVRRESRAEYLSKIRDLVDEGADEGAVQTAICSLRLACLFELSQPDIHRDEYLHEILSDITFAVYRATTESTTDQQYADIVCDTFEKITNSMLNFHSKSIARDVRNEIAERQGMIDYADTHADAFNSTFDYYE